ncbi:MAG: hypothetical protein QOK04_1125 [Solirubrobacteraceae bacterium]|jgi:hypothetical protein|nr:hypothetical protein [Solirubrobacteraceae bacterium]
MAIPAAELDGLIARLEAAASRLKDQPAPTPAAPAPASGSDLQSALDGLAHASVEVHRARARVEELAAALQQR